MLNGAERGDDDDGRSFRPRHSYLQMDAGGDGDYDGDRRPLATTIGQPPRDDRRWPLSPGYLQTSGDDECWQHDFQCPQKSYS